MLQLALHRNQNAVLILQKFGIHLFSLFLYHYSRDEKMNKNVLMGFQPSTLKQGNLLKGIVIWLVAARSVVQSPVRALDSNFSNTFSLFQLLHLFNFYK